MFYSQFILAKKGPLGTIWIAAHLERKLKKNQVADTDIGVSVDSILFPEVPIALRLSSHLLLGVVRIYSRQVNYLFHDCSEALLKVKQAFRSTAVDLPPEESTAPYHSITLPETFDLDGFELPDSALLHGNFDDRHVSTREQITLQDTLDRTGYSTSLFGLDERFGDGDASQMGLDLDEELLFENNHALQDASVLDGVMHQSEGAADLTKTGVEGQHDYHEDRTNGASEELSDLLGGNRGKQIFPNVENAHTNDESSHRLIFNIRTPDLNEVFLPDDHVGGPSIIHDIDMDFDSAGPPSLEFNRSANFPSTPGLLEEAIGAHSQELPASNPKNIALDATPEADKLDKPINEGVTCPDLTDGPINAVSASPKLTSLAQVVSSPTSVLSEPKPDSTVPVNGVGQNHIESQDIRSTTSTASTPVLIKPVVNSMEPQYSSATVAGSGTDYTSRKTDPLHTITAREEGNGQQASMDYSLMSEIALPIGVPHEDTTRLSHVDPGRVEHATSLEPSNETVAAPGLDSTLRDDDTLHTRTAREEWNGQQVSMGHPMASEIVSHIGVPVEDTTRLSNVDPGRVEDAHSLEPQFSNVTVTAPGSDSTLREAATLHTGTAREEGNGQQVSMDHSLVSPIGVPHADTTRLSNVDAVRVEDASSFEPQFSNETVASPGFNSSLREATTLHIRSVPEEGNGQQVSIGQQVSMDHSMVSEIASPLGVPLKDTIKLSNVNPCRVEDASSCQTSNFSAWSSAPIGVPHKDTTRLSNVNPCHVEDANSCQASNLSAWSSAFHLRPCTSESSQPNLIPSWNMVQERAHERLQQTPVGCREMHFNGSYVDQRGLHPVVSTATNVGAYQNSVDNLFGLHSAVNNPVEPSPYCNPKDVQSGHWNYFSSSEISEPERMRFAVSGGVTLLNDPGPQTTEKAVIESDGSVDRISNLSGQKRRLVDSTPYLQNDMSPMTLGIPRKKQNSDYVPNDDDLLASILVGRTPAMRIGPTPPLPKPLSSKRPRLTTKAGFPKRRKVLLDDTVVLHADAIRQQLINTEDIRRMRKKAPCTHPEVWRIQKSSQEDDIFHESMFTGASETLNRLLTRNFYLGQNVQSQVNAPHSSGEAIVSKEAKLSRSSVFRGNNGQQMAEHNAVLPKSVEDTMQVQSAVSKFIVVESYNNAVPVGAQKQLQPSLDPHHLDLPHNMISSAELEKLEHTGTAPAMHPDSSFGIDEKRDDLCSDTDKNSLNEVSTASQGLQKVNNSLVHVADNNSFEDFVSADILLNGKDFSDTKATYAAVKGMGLDVVTVDNLNCPQDSPVNASNNVVATIDIDSSPKGKDFSDASATYGSVEGMGLGAVTVDNFNFPQDGQAIVSNNVIVAIDIDNSLKKNDFSDAKATYTAVEGMGLGDVIVDNLGCPQDGPANRGADDCGGASVSSLDRFMVETGQEFPIDDRSTIARCVEASMPEMVLGGGGLFTSDCHAMSYSEVGEVTTKIETSLDEGRPASELPGGERPHILPISTPPCTEGERVPSAVGENSSLNIEGGLDVESEPLEFAATRESSDFCSAIDDINTDFLNADDDDDDDDEYDEEANDDGSNIDAQSLENSGWSSRTRGVARYLKNMFDQESGRGRKSIAIDHLLTGKTRKEASRMFFETLVLKTKDFVHVEQENPFDFINIKPRIKLLKSEF